MEDKWFMMYSLIVLSVIVAIILEVSLVCLAIKYLPKYISDWMGIPITMMMITITFLWIQYLKERYGR